jgi:DNA-binding transcriptional ArsR family regulator
MSGDVFRALGDPTRRCLLDSLNAHGGQSLGELCRALRMTRQSVSRHLRILEDAKLVVTVKRGREKLHYLDATLINEVAVRWISQYRQDDDDALADLERALREARNAAARLPL